MQHDGEQRTGLAFIDWSLITVIVIICVLAASMALLVPPWSCWCLDVLDARGWNRWTWIAVVASLIVVLTVIRFRPTGQPREADVVAGESVNAGAPAAVERPE